MKKKCTECNLGKSCTAHANASAGWGNPQAKLVIVLDCPGGHLEEALLVWLLKKAGLIADDVWVDYTFKCPIESKIRKELHLEYYKKCWKQYPRNEIENNHTLILCGNYSVQLLAGEKLKDINGRKAKTDAWCIYSMGYALMNPAICVDIWRVIFKAAEEAGLKPKLNQTLEVFKFPSKKLR